ncbi:MAG TPA: manganese efflux pump MntP family protein [Salinisphaeraceae bacterium]|nr:manganese efflux pump MntP family protein [Salinisphaeraceae bacterium]
MSLSMDAFAASIAQGAQTRGTRLRQALRTALYFGTFEAVTPIIGWTLGVLIGSAMAQIDHWVAFSLLLAIGLKMIRDAVCGHGTTGTTGNIKSTRLALLALSTSIDAAAVGVTLVVLKIPIIMAALIIGAITFIFSCAGFMLGGFAGQRLPRLAEAAGGLLLIGIGVKILLFHLVIGQ